MSRAVKVQGIECQPTTSKNLLDVVVETIIKNIPSSQVKRHTMEPPFVQVGDRTIVRESKLITLYGLEDKTIIVINEDFYGYGEIDNKKCIEIKNKIKDITKTNVIVLAYAPFLYGREPSDDYQLVGFSDNLSIIHDKEVNHP